jgi:hypothetical protein
MKYSIPLTKLIANHPIPIAQATFYFEVTHKEGSLEYVLCFGGAIGKEGTREERKGGKGDLNPFPNSEIVSILGLFLLKTRSRILSRQNGAASITLKVGCSALSFEFFNYYKF